MQRSQQIAEANERRRSQVGSMASSKASHSVNKGQESFFEDGYNLEESKEPLNPPAQQENAENTSNPRASFLDIIQAKLGR